MSKYPRTYHLPESPGATNDDKTLDSVDSFLHKTIVITEKMDGSNVCLTRDEVFARSHNGPPKHPSFNKLKAFHASIRHKLPENYFFFGEWCEAVHSIRYDRMAEPPLFLFAVRYDAPENKRNMELSKNGEGGFFGSYWEPWPQVVYWAHLLGIKTVPVLGHTRVESAPNFDELIDHWMNKPSTYGKLKEGLVIRVHNGFYDSEFMDSVAKMVRENHVETDQHWAQGEYNQHGT